VIKGAITTDFILSCEIMVISLTEVADESLWVRAFILIVVAFAITVVVYGAVALIVKMDDIGLHLTTKDSAGSQRFGELLVKGMPAVLAAITFIGTIAMLWVGGHIMLQGAYDLGWHLPYDLVHVSRNLSPDSRGGRLLGVAREHTVFGGPRSRLGSRRHGYRASAAESAAVRQGQGRARGGRRPRRTRRF
jgi:predicted DNA repair protein MutK